MSGQRKRRYWVVKHGLDSLEALPNYIWNTGSISGPRGFQSVAVGDWWIGFAHTTSDARERSLSLVTGFNECVERSRYRDIPRHAQKLEGSAKRGWMIRGRLAANHAPRWASRLSKTSSRIGISGIKQP